MPRFAYVALDSRGQESTGLVDAASTNDAIGQLRQAGYFPTTVYEEGQGSTAQKKAQARRQIGRCGGSGHEEKRDRSFSEENGQSQGADGFYPPARDPD